MKQRINEKELPCHRPLYKGRESLVEASSLYSEDAISGGSSTWHGMRGKEIKKKRGGCMGEI